MNRLARIGLVVLGFLLVVVLVAAAAVVYLVRRPFPKVDGRLTVSGLQSEVNVYRDQYGIPHIYADNEHDLFFAQGYVHAQDRFWQMEFWRHIGQGRISEMVGPDGVSNDRFIRTMGWNRIAQETVDYFRAEEPDYFALLEAYSAGVTAYIEANRNQLSLTHTVLGLVREPWEIEPWTPLDTVGWGVVMSDDLSGNWRSEVNRARLIKELGEATVVNLLPTYPYDSRPVIAPTSLLQPAGDEEPGEPGGESSRAPFPTGQAIDWQRVNTNVIDGRPELGFVLGSQPWVGSNNWVVGGQHTASGLPLLANDPHLALQLPAIWYQVGLHGAGFDVVGFSFAGAPGVIIGRNAHIAWGVTNLGPDVQDLYIEKINPSNPRQYEYRGAWEDMVVVEEIIKVNGGEDVRLEVLTTRHGPIVSDLVDGSSDVLAMRWTAQEPSRVLQSVIMLNQAENYEQFREALRYWDVPAQNFVYADVDGNIAYQAPGRIPVRQRGDGLAPMPGWTGEYEWAGWIPYEELPALFNPEDGFIVTANNAVVDHDYPYQVSIYWADGDRAQRITEMLATAVERGNVTADDFARIQFDSKSLLADSYVPLLSGLSSNNAQVQAALERLRGWDRQVRRDSVPAALFEVFRVHLDAAILADDVGADNVSQVSNGVLLHQLAAAPDAIWWDDRSTAETEGQEAIILRALADTVAWFQENVGGDMNQWTWGSIHTANFVSAPLGQSGIGLIEAMVNRGPFPADGTSSAVNNLGWNSSNIAAVRGHPSMRMIIDLGDPDGSRAIIPTGQSGHPYHRHYDDLMPLWLNGEYHPLLFGETAVQAAASHLILQPEAGP